MRSLSVIIFMLLASYSFSQNLNTKSVAFEGYDVVAYFSVQQAVEGSDKLSLKIEDIHYYFSSAENLNLFRESPHKYIPKYGGYCAIGVAWDGERYPIDPESFLIDEGELYLFCPGEKDNWIADKESLKHQADLNWAKMTSAKNN